MTAQEEKVIAANIALHSQIVEEYNNEPHFNPENVENVRSKLHSLVMEFEVKKLLDMGCGTGFIIQIAKDLVPEITGVDVTRAMLDKVDTSGSAKIELHCHDIATFPVEEGSYQMVTAYSFLHHLYSLNATIQNAYRALEKGGVFYADLEPNYYYWEALSKLDRSKGYSPIVKREIEMCTYKDEDILNTFGVEKETFNQAEYGKNILGGFKEEELKDLFYKIGFQKVEIVYEWFLGQRSLVQDPNYPINEKKKRIQIVLDTLKESLPLSRQLFKYMGIVATK